MLSWPVPALHPTLRAPALAQCHLGPVPERRGRGLQACPGCSVPVPEGPVPRAGRGAGGPRGELTLGPSADKEGRPPSKEKKKKKKKDKEVHPSPPRGRGGGRPGLAPW